MSNSEILSKPVSALAEEAGGEFATGFKTAPNLFVVPEQESDEELTPGQGSAYDLSCASTFNAVSMPAGFERLNMNRLLGGNMRMDFSTNGIGGITEVNGIKYGKDGEPEEEEEENFDKLRDVLEQANEERKQWAQATHSFAGVEMTGSEWGEFSNELKSNSMLRQWLLAKMMKDGKTKGEAEELVNKISEIARIQAIPESQRTEEEKALVKEAEAEPEVKEYLTQTRDQQLKFSEQENTLSRQAANSGTVSSVAAGADMFDGFSSAPQLSLHHRQALAATTPLEGAQTTVNVPTPVIDNRPSVGAGFEV